MWKDQIFSDIRNMSVRIAPNSVRCAVILWLLLFLRSVWSPSKVTFTAITLLIPAFLKSYGQFSLVCYRDNNIKPCFSYMRMIKINSKPFVISDKKWPTPFNMSRAPPSSLSVFRVQLHWFKRTFIESSSKQMDSHKKLNICYNKNCSDPRSCLLFTSVFDSIPNF